jgi:hypothetical protein
MSDGREYVVLDAHPARTSEAANDKAASKFDFMALLPLLRRERL